MLQRIVPASVALSMLVMFGFARQTTQPTPEQIVTPSGLTIIELGNDEIVASPGDDVTVHYTGKLENGHVFDSSTPTAEPLTFKLGSGRVIKGWEEGVAGMKVGQKRQLIIPASLGYGDVGNPPAIPGGATLVFDIQVLYINRGLQK